MTHRFLCAVLCLLAARSAGAQQELTLPASLYRAVGGQLMSLPFGKTRTFTQVWYRGDGVPTGRVLSAVGFRPDESLVSPARTVRFELVIDNSPLAFGALSATFAQNLSPQATTVFAMKNVNIGPVTAATPSTVLTWATLDQPIAYVGPHLLVQIDHQTTATPQPLGLNLDAWRMQTTQPAEVGFTPLGCGARLATTYTGGQLGLTLSGGTPGAPVAFLLGVDNQLLGGVVPLPVDLGFLGLTGCRLEVDPVVQVPRAIDIQGRASLYIPYPVAPGAESVVVFAQALHGGAATPAGLATTNLAYAVLGNTGYMNVLYNYNVVGPTAEAGPYPANRGPVLFVR